MDVSGLSGAADETTYCVTLYVLMTSDVDVCICRDRHPVHGLPKGFERSSGYSAHLLQWTSMVGEKRTYESYFRIYVTCIEGWILSTARKYSTGGRSPCRSSWIWVGLQTTGDAMASQQECKTSFFSLLQTGTDYISNCGLIFSNTCTISEYHCVFSMSPL